MEIIYVKTNLLASGSDFKKRVQIELAILLEVKKTLSNFPVFEILYFTYSRSESNYIEKYN